ncbi:MAG: ankyrin repeat domain-containing protein [Candidatus Cybelea sp.]
MPTRQLPSNPNLQQLKAQAKDLLRGQRASLPQAAQRFREFHPRFRDASDERINGAALRLSDAQFAIAREYGFASWPKLKAYVEDPNREDLKLPPHLRIKDQTFRRAVDLLDAGDAEGLRKYLEANPGVVRQHMTFEGWNYFREPALLEFIAENPTRRGSLPANAADLARVILDAGGRDDRESVDSALQLVASSDVAYESGVQIPLIDVLCDYGADPSAATYTALLYHQFEAVAALIRRGAKADLIVAAAMGELDAARDVLADADAETRQRALAMAAQQGHVEIVRLLLDAGEAPNRFAPVGGHSHATPLHQAALAGHEDVVRLLVERGARTEIRDILHGGTPLDWAQYGKQTTVAEYLREHGSDSRW